MKVEKIIFRSVESHRKWFTSQQFQETFDILVKAKWDHPNRLRLWGYEDIDAVVIRGKNAKTKPEVLVGSLLHSQHEDGKVIYYDDIYWTEKFGRSCVFTNNGPVIQLFMKGHSDRIDTKNTENNLVWKIAMRNVLNRMGIEIELDGDADTYLLPSRNKFSCGYSRMSKRTEEEVVRYEAGWITYLMDHDLFQQILPESEYLRTDSRDPDHAGINGIKNEFPDFNREEFETQWFLEIATLIEENPTVHILTTKYI